MKYKILSRLNDYWYCHFRPLMAVMFYVLALFFYFLGANLKARSICCASLRYGVGSSSTKLFKKIVSRFPFTKEDTTKNVSLAEAARRTIVVQWPDIKNNICCRKGILIVTFTRTFSFYLRNINLEELGKYFHIVLEPSWSGYADPDVFAFMGRVDKVFIQASELQDRALLNSFPDDFVATSFGASDWVDSKKFSPIMTEKKYDSIYVANTNPLKRVKRYLDAVKNIIASGLNEYTGCLICASWGGAEKLVAKMVSDYQLDKNIVLKFDLSTEQVVEALNQSKVNVLLSYKEGSNRSLFESMFCGTPVICLYENVGVNKSYINEHTGALIFDSMLEDTLIWMMSNYSYFSPRQWAIENISPEKTTEKLIKLINPLIAGGDSSAKEAQKVFLKINNPEVAYCDFVGLRPKDYSRPLLELFMSESVDYGPRLIELNTQFLNDLSK